MFLYELAFIFHNDQLIGSLRHYFDQYPFWLYQTTSSEMPTSGDLKSQKGVFSDQQCPPPPTQKISFFIWTPYPPPPSNFLGKTSGTSIGLILIQSDSPIYRSNREEETLSILFAMNNMHQARKWSQKP